MQYREAMVMKSSSGVTTSCEAVASNLAHAPKLRQSIHLQVR